MADMQSGLFTALTENKELYLKCNEKLSGIILQITIRQRHDARTDGN